MLTSVYFRCGITKMHENEELELRKLCEVPFLKKLGYSINFPQNMMYVSKEMLRLGLFLPTTIIAMHRLKLYLGNKRIKPNVSRMIRGLEE